VTQADVTGDAGSPSGAATSAAEPSGQGADTAHHDGPLPDAVRQRVVTLASAALGNLPLEEVPSSLRPFARFTPRKRARLAMTPVAAALESDALFRQRVAEQVRQDSPELSASVAAGRPPAAADPLDVAAVAFLLRPAGWRELVVAAGRAAVADTAAAESAQARGALTRLQEQLEATRVAARSERDRWRAELETVRAENADLRRRLKGSMERARLAETAEAAARMAGEQARTAAAAAAARSEAELRRLKARVAGAEAAVEGARRAAREGRSMDDLRLRLLLDTVLEGAQGLRRELALPPATARPADAVEAVTPPAASVDNVAERALAGDDPALLDQLLALPQVHLVVDGYNVTKSGYGEVPLADQRTRLLAGLGSLAARCAAEVTCVFDGAALDGPVPLSAPRGVRVVFSQPDELADDLIRRLVHAEPRGRPVVVVSSDREVADGVRAAGARPVPATLLLRWLGRG